jgi:hypothetical protein
LFYRFLFNKEFVRDFVECNLTKLSWSFIIQCLQKIEYSNPAIRSTWISCSSVSPDSILVSQLTFMQKYWGAGPARPFPSSFLYILKPQNITNLTHCVRNGKKLLMHWFLCQTVSVIIAWRVPCFSGIGFQHPQNATIKNRNKN